MRSLAALLSFKGKETRQGFFVICLCAPFLLLLQAIIIFVVLGMSRSVFEVFSPVFYLLGNLTVLMSATFIFLAGCRRSRDIGWSPWWAALLLLPPCGIVVLLLFLFRRGQADALGDGRA